MALMFVDSFDHYATAQLPSKWTSPGSAAIQAVTVRHGIQALQIGPAGVPNCSITLPPKATWIIGFGFRVSALPVATDDMCYTMDYITAQGVLRVRADGTLQLLRGATSVVISTRALAVNTWYYIEFKHTIAAAGGLLEVKVNGEVWATFGGNTQQTANAFANVLAVSATGANPGGFNYFDDLYILDGDGAAPNNDYWGDTQIDALVPDGPGNYQEFVTLVGAASHFQAVNEIPPNEDTSYIAENLVNDRDTFTFANLSVASAIINGIQVLVRTREDAAGGAHLARMYRSGVTDDQGVDVAINTGYHYWLREIMETDPIAIGAWTVANVNAAEFGFRVR